MSFEMRQRLATAWVAELMAHYDPPAKKSPEWQAQELKDMTAAVVRHLPTDTAEAALADVLERVRLRVKEGRRTRQWPTVHEVLDALHAEKNISDGGSDRPPDRLAARTVDWMLEYIHKGRAPPSKYWDEPTAIKLVIQRRATVEQIRKTGGVLSAEEAKKLRADGFN